MAHFLCHLGCSHFGALLLDFHFTENRSYYIQEIFFANFYSAEIKTEYGRLYLLENAYYPWIAFAKNLDFTRIEFIESPFANCNNKLDTPW